MIHRGVLLATVITFATCASAQELETSAPVNTGPSGVFEVHLLAETLAAGIGVRGGVRADPHLALLFGGEFYPLPIPAWAVLAGLESSPVARHDRRFDLAFEAGVGDLRVLGLPALVYDEPSQAHLLLRLDLAWLGRDRRGVFAGPHLLLETQLKGVVRREHEPDGQTQERFLVVGKGILVLFGATIEADVSRPDDRRHGHHLVWSFGLGPSFWFRPLVLPFATFTFAYVWDPRPVAGEQP